MSARDEVARELARAQAYYPELLDRYEDAILREAADKIRRMAYAMRSCDGTWDEEFSNEYVSDALGFATDLIDPDNA